MTQPKGANHMSEQATELSFNDAMSQAYDTMMSETTADEQHEVVAEEQPEATPEEKPADEQAKAEEAPEDEKPEEKPAEQKPEVKAPGTWSPTAREKFATLDPDLQAEIAKREKDMETFVHSTAVERKVAQNFQHVVQPYMEHLQQMGVSPYEAIGSLLQLGKKLTTGDAKAKAAVLGELFSNYEVDLDALNDAIIERMKGPKPSATEKQLMDKLERIERQITTPAPKPTEQNASFDLTASIKSFVEDPQFEFVNDVWQDMQKLLAAENATDAKDAQAKLKAAYDKACLISPEVQKVKARREAEAKARVQNANVSLKGGTPKTTAKTTTHMDTRDVLSKAWDEMMGQ